MRSHRFDAISFGFGILFLALTASAVWEVNYDWGFDISRWILPVAFLTIGVALLVSGVRTAIKKQDEQ